MKRSNAVLLAVALSAFGLVQPMSSRVQAATDQNNFFPIDILVFVPCADAGAGEYVELTGELHDLFHVTANANGFHIKGHDNPQGVSGTGLTTGVKYQGTGVTQFEQNMTVGAQYTSINNFRIIGQGPGNKYLVHDNFHMTINLHEEVTSYHDNFSVKCK